MLQKEELKMRCAFQKIIVSQLAGFLFHAAVMLCLSFSELQCHDDGWGQLAGMCVCVFLVVAS